MEYALSIICCLITLTTACDNRDADVLPNVPYYFLAIHNEPNHVQGGSQKLQEQYKILRQMVSRADQYNIKLTLMFTAQWVDMLTSSSAGQADLKAWKAAGHEIAAHHHSIYHGNWDGYTDYTKAEAEVQRHKQNKKPETYLGTLATYMARLKQINPQMKSGCVNDESDKRAMPDGIIYDTCSGFANHGEVGRRSTDTEAEKGRNEYISVGTYRGIQRKWLTHYQVTTDERQKQGQAMFAKLGGAHAFGGVTHSIAGQDTDFYTFLEFLNRQDPNGDRSHTVAEIIDGGLIPEMTLSQELVNKMYTPGASTPAGKCGDGTCDAVEKANPKNCPADCK